MLRSILIVAHRQLRPQDDYIGRRRGTDPHLVALQAQHSDFDAFTAGCFNGRGGV